MSSSMNFVHCPPCLTVKDNDALKSSPVSVASKINPTVVMCDDGAEVTLGNCDTDMAQLILSTPSSKPIISELERRFIVSALPTHSLLDDEVGPSPTSPDENRPQRMNFWCGSASYGCYRCDDQEALVITSPMMERTVSNFLGSTTGADDWCTSWQAWTYFEMDNFADDRILELKDDIKSVLRNRACNIGARASRITDLKENLHPFDATPKRKGAPISKTVSFSVGSEQRKKLRTHAHHTSLAAFPSTMLACMESESAESPFVIRTRGLEEDLFYDSDPEECTKRRSPHRTRAKSKMTFWNKSLESKSANGLSGMDERHHRLESINMTDDHQVLEHVQEVMNQRFTMVWHQGLEKNSTPVAIIAWIERGQQLDRQLIQPRLVWKRLHDGGAPNDRHSVDLLDISRILEVDQIDRSVYPLAQQRNCLCIRTLDGKMMFEASNEEERNRLCRDLKLVVARLASKIILDDQHLFHEFFVEGMFPGYDASWIVPRQQI